MSHLFDRSRLMLHPLAGRPNRVRIHEVAARAGDPPRTVNAEMDRAVAALVGDIHRARTCGAPVVLAFGAHAIKNGLGPLLADLIAAGWITHLATNGAGIIHDWELAYQGATSEHVSANIASGSFGLWEETGLYLNLAIAVGAYRGLGYGESVGALVEQGGLLLPDEGELLTAIGEAAKPAGGTAAGRAADEAETAAAACDLLSLYRRRAWTTGFLEVAHRFREYGLQATAFRLNVPYTGHPMFGHDIIYCHPANVGGAVGRTAERDFLSFAESIRRIDGGVYLSIGSAVMSPMIFEKSFAMAQNLAIQAGHKIEGHRIYVVDLARQNWDWRRDGEPPESDPAYYLRFMKTFSRMGGTVRYVAGDNREFLMRLALALEVTATGTPAAGV